MDIGKANTKILQEESTLGIYVWEMPDGRWIGDDDGNFLSITSKKEIDPESMLWLEKFAHTVYMKAGLNFFQLDARLQTKSTQNKNKDLGGD